jgi:outer membrane usher protein
MQHGQGAGSFDLSGALERTPRNAGVNGSATYIASSGELGVDHLITFDGDAGAPMDSRTNLRFATSFAFADGAASIGRPISDSFAIVSRRENVGNTRVNIDLGPFGYTAGTTLLGTATVPNLMSYNDRTITVDAPDINADVDLGPGAYRVLPPYRSGYRLRVGTDYPITMIGRFLDEDGAPLSLISGTATEVAAPSREPLPVFTNRAGRFGITGVKAGRWRIEFRTDPVTTYVVEVPAGITGVASVGDVMPLGADAPP